ncbi:hypothetical protein AKJ16_DCAP26813, partial [Drosera capensis]
HFHEVKSKREKKKEPKDTLDSRPRGASNRGAKGGVDWHGGHGGASQYVSSESVASRGKPTYKRENGTTASATSLSSSSVVGSNVIQRPLPSSDPVIGYKAFSGEKQEGILSSHPSSGFQPAWSTTPGQKSMADIVKMGRPYGNRNVSQQRANHHVTVTPASGPHDLHSSEHFPAIVPDMHPNSLVSVNQLVPLDDDWPMEEHPPATNYSSIQEPSIDPGVYVDPSNTYYETLNHQLHSQSDEVHYPEDDELNNTHPHLTGSLNGTDLQQDDTSVFDNDLYKNVGSYQVHQHGYAHQEVEDIGISVASVSTNLQQLNLANEDEDSPSETGSPAVKIPEHLQVQSADCSHLSFGSFGSGLSGPFSGPFAASRPLKTDLEEPPVEADGPPVGNLDIRNPEYYGDEHLLSTADGNISRLTVSAENYDSSSTSQPDVLKQESPEVVQDQYTFPSSAPNYAYEDDQQLNPSHAHSQTSPQMQNISQLPSVMPYPNTLPGGLLPSNVQSLRESELPYSAFPISQSMPTKYSSAMSSITGPNISLTEALRTANFSSAQSTQAGSSVLGGAALQQQQQHLALHPYSQASLPFPNMVGFPLLPQSYGYMPSAFTHSFAGNSSYQQAIAAMLPQYKNNISVGSLPQSATGAYGAFGNSSPGNFPLNQPAAGAGTSMGYDDILSSQYKDVNHALSLHQIENAQQWVQGHGSRTMSAVPASTYYSMQGPSQQPAAFRQSQQVATQHYGNLGYQNIYHSQGGMLSLEHQQQLAREGSSLGGGAGSQGQSKQSQQMWQNNY